MVDPVMTDSFPFSLQDFSIIVRQALVSVFETQDFTQFIQPINATSGNYFKPLLCNFGTYGNTEYQKLMIPQLFVENLNSLKMHEYQPDVKFKANKNIFRFIPVLGYFYQDELANFAFEYNSVSVPLFTTLLQTPINLNDGSSAGTFVNFNCTYYKSVLDNWNNFCEVAAQYSTPQISIAGDKGPQGLQLITLTRFESTIDEGFRGKNIPKWIRSRIMNLPTDRKLKRNNSKENLKELPPASISFLSVQAMTSVTVISQEMSSMLDYLLLPVQRIDNFGNPPTSVQLFQTESAESYIRNYSNQVGSLATGSPIMLQLQNMATMCAPGTAAAATSTYSDLIRTLTMRSEAAGLLSSLAGGLLSSVGLGSLAEFV